MKVFLSSTAQDLFSYRAIADNTILRLKLESVVMERFGPLPGEPVAECERKASECDLVLCIVAHRYGFVPDKGRGSITRREVEAARAAGKDVFVWIVADDYPWTQIRDQDLLTDPVVVADPLRVAEVVANVAALGDFKRWLRATYVCEPFGAPEDLGRKIAIALANYVTSGMRAAATTAAATTARDGEIRVVHALQPAPHFHGRQPLVSELSAWIQDLASPDRVWSLVAPGGTGKTAVVERVVRQLQPSEANVLVWSFYERPDTDAFLRECNDLFLGEEGTPAGGRLERLERGLRDGRSHLIVLDGLEGVQEDAVAGRLRGELSDQPLKLLLRVIAHGLGRVRALVTSRFSLVDLRDWLDRGYRETRLDDLTPDAAVAVLRSWGVVGDEVDLRTAAAQVGHHALSIAVIGSYLRSFASGRIEEVASFELETVAGEDPKAARLARILAFYATRLPTDERALLARLSVFPRGVTQGLLESLIHAGSSVAGELVNAKPRLVRLLTTLKDRGLVFEYPTNATPTWTAHPFLRDSFRRLLDCPAEQVFDVVARSLRVGLDQRPRSLPTEAIDLDRYERLVETTFLAGREQEAFDLYWFGMGNFRHLGWTLGEFQRGYRILAAFSTTGRADDLGPQMVLHERAVLAADLALYALRTGRLKESRTIREVDDHWKRTTGRAPDTWIGLGNTAEVAFAQGRLAESRTLGDMAVELLEASDGAPDHWRKAYVFATRAITAHALGDVRSARVDFATATQLHQKPLVSIPGANQARHCVDLGDFSRARALCAYGLEPTRAYAQDFAHFHAVLARIGLAEKADSKSHIQEIRAWTARTGDMQFVIEAHLLAARELAATGDLQGAFAEADSGLLHATACGFELLRTELLVVTARIYLALPEVPKAIQAGRAALDLASNPDSRFAWGEAEAAQVWGEAYFANNEPALAKRAFERALAVRKRIEHPETTETEMWLARVGS